jgi:hypothetical protein
VILVQDAASERFDVKATADLVFETEGNNQEDKSTVIKDASVTSDATKVRSDGVARITNINVCDETDELFMEGCQ